MERVRTQIIKDVQNGIFGLAFDRIEISVAATNVVSRKLFEKAGFVSASADGALIGYVCEKNNRPLGKRTVLPWGKGEFFGHRADSLFTFLRICAILLSAIAYAIAFFITQPLVYLSLLNQR